MNAPQGAARDTDADTLELDAIDVSDPKLYRDDTWYPYLPGCAARTRCITAGKASTGRIGR
jgi:hypothetical protein